MSNNKGIDQSDRTRKLRHLHELIAALDRRVPHVERIGEIEIAREGRALREKALQRIAELEPSLETSHIQGPLPRGRSRRSRRPQSRWAPTVVQLLHLLANPLVTILLVASAIAASLGQQPSAR